ncbi:tol-pal system protein YbgF [Azorhizobium doebereinerae]|uniref:tol-pal system protein YbgF n=1 Tax=Azorhizobium doebereinerae TaxID=281091 RepID=UPI00048C9857|nr:tol-pal system protein YbgF [Azorhizobium doebereinerae]
MNRNGFLKIVLVIAGVAALSGPASAQQSGGGLFGDIFKPPANVQNDAVANQQSELLMRIERIENQLRQLTGQIEQLQYRNQQLEQQLNARAGGPPPATAAAPVAPRPAIPAPAATAPTGRRSDAFDPNEDPAAPGVPQPLGSPASASAAPPRPTGAPLDIGAGQRPAAQPTALPASTPKDLYDLGYSYVQRQDYPAAEQTFRQFLQAYPGDRLTPDATFMLGESLYLRQTYKEAAEQFLQVSTKYPNYTKAPDALLRLGQSLVALNEREAACATFAEVDRKFPRATSNLRQAVEREQKRAGC